MLGRFLLAIWYLLIMTSFFCVSAAIVLIPAFYLGWAWAAGAVTMSIVGALICSKKVPSWLVK